MSERLTRFTDLMRSIFELDKSDLDFGIYRILNIRRTKIDDFLTKGLPQKVQETLKPFAEDGTGISKRLKEIEDTAQAAGIEITASPVWAAEYEALKKKKAAGTDISALETDVYSALYSFFNRYYDEGDFISKRRYKEGVYAIPYEGEEVKLYWANQDQYYIKTSENFKDYTFIEQGISVHFRLVDATTEQNNVKESDDSKRVFMLFVEDEHRYPGIKTFEYDTENKSYIIRFVFDIPEDKKRKYAQENYEAIKADIVNNHDSLIAILLRDISPDPKKPKTVLQKHLDAYVAKNIFDYFIHKDLGGFLRRELDFYIKTEVMYLDDLDTTEERKVETWLSKVKAIKRVGHIIIDFLAQLEDFQKKLWLKKKFVVETNWCITLDRIVENFWSEIVANQAQVQEWKDYYAIQEAAGWSNPPSMAFLRDNQNLVVDTRHFNQVFRDRLVASIEDVDGQTDGLIIWSENFQALELLVERFNKQIKCVYVDPPYNAKSSLILYKNTFKHSSWLTLMENRVSASLPLLSHDFVYVTALDEVESHRYEMLEDKIFSNTSGKTIVSSVINPSGQQGKNFSTNDEYLHFIYSDEKNMLGKEERAEGAEDVRNFMNTLKGSSTNYLRASGKNCFYPVYIEKLKDDYVIVDFGDVCEDDFHPGSPNVQEGSRIAVYPIDADGVERKWVFERGTVEEIVEELDVKESNGVYTIERTKSEINYKTLWKDPKHSAKTYGTSLLKNILGHTIPGMFPKSIHATQDCVRIAVNENKEAIILDFFAGSGTTGHAVINLNRQDGGQRKYILVEMGNYFNTVTKPRMQKVIYADSWKDGKPKNRNTGVSHLMKYIRLESYEDALSNISLDTHKGNLLAGLFGEEYLVRYLLDTEAKDSLLDVQAFQNPFQYKMKITENNEVRLRKVDLVETFNYLIGLKVNRQSTVDTFHASPDSQGGYEGALRLSRDDGGEFAFQQVEGRLPDGRRALVIWRSLSDDLLRSNAALDAYFTRYRINPAEGEYDVIFVNGDNNLENIRKEDEPWKVVMTELEFKAKMFEEAEK